MESTLNREYEKLVDELTQGLENAMKLRVHLRSTSPSEAHDLLLQKVTSTFENALLILMCGGSVGRAPTGAPTSSALYSSSPKSEDTSKKRKLQSTWTEQVRVSCENGVEGLRDDGYSWRKYGQKGILGAKHPRSYYRCTYRFVRNCWATKQVQRSDDDPTVYEVTYKGKHTCNQTSSAVSPPASPQKQDLRDNINSHYHQPKQLNQTLSDFKGNNLGVNTNGDLNITDISSHFSFPSTFSCADPENYNFPIPAPADENHVGTYSPLFYSPATSESNYFSAGTCQMTSYASSTTNSPISGMDFLIDPVDLDPNFPLDIPGFFN